MFNEKGLGCHIVLYLRSASCTTS